MALAAKLTFPFSSSCLRGHQLHSPLLERRRGGIICTVTLDMSEIWLAKPACYFSVFFIVPRYLTKKCNLTGKEQANMHGSINAVGWLLAKIIGLSFGKFSIPETKIFPKYSFVANLTVGRSIL